MGVQHLYMDAVYYVSYGCVVYKQFSRIGNGVGN